MAVGFTASSSSARCIKADSSSRLVVGPLLFLFCMPAACGMRLVASNRKLCERGGPGQAGPWHTQLPAAPTLSEGQVLLSLGSGTLWVGCTQGCWSCPCWPARADGVHPNSMFSDIHVGSLKLAMERIFTPRKSVNATNQCFFFFFFF